MQKFGKSFVFAVIYKNHTDCIPIEFSQIFAIFSFEAGKFEDLLNHPLILACIGN